MLKRSRIVTGKDSEKIMFRYFHNDKLHGIILHIFMGNNLFKSALEKNRLNKTEIKNKSVLFLKYMIKR